MELRSAAFADGKPIPVRHTCDGADVSPPIAWSDVDPRAKSLTLVCHDPDAPAGDWVHWVVYDVPPARTELPEGVPPDERVQGGGTQGTNDFRRLGWGGPCPPSGTHRYLFTLYAVDAETGLAPGARRSDVEAAIRGHVVAEAKLTGTFTRRS